MVLQQALDFYCRPGGLVIDLTANRRRMWKGIQWSGPVVYADTDLAMKPAVAASFLAMPFAAAVAAVIVFDPPHLPAAAGSIQSFRRPTARADRQIVRDYGLQHSTVRVDEWFGPVLIEAARVLTQGGILIAKLKDFVHNHRYQWQLHRFIAAVESTDGLTPCDLIVKVDPCGGNLKSGRWVKQHHVRNAHTWFVIVRKGRCEP